MASSCIWDADLIFAGNAYPAQVHLDPRRLVFIDETWIKTSMAPPLQRSRQEREEEVP